MSRAIAPDAEGQRASRAEWRRPSDDARLKPRKGPRGRADCRRLYSAAVAHRNPECPPSPPTRPHATDELLGHPKGLYVCFFTEMWERFSFYGMKALLLLYLTKYHLLRRRHRLRPDRRVRRPGLCDAGDRRPARRPLARHAQGGRVRRHPARARPSRHGDRRHIRRRSVNGVVTRDAGALQVFYFSLALIIMGVGFLKPNISTIVGKLYRRKRSAPRFGLQPVLRRHQPRRDCFAVCSAAGSARPTAGARVSAPPASACSPASRTSSGARNTCTATPNRRDPARAARARVRPAHARASDLPRRDRGRSS